MHLNGERGIVAHLSTFDEEEGVILAKGIVHESLPRHRGFHYRTFFDRSLAILR